MIQSVRFSVCRHVWWNAELQRGYLYGYDAISDRQKRCDTYHNAWFSKRECAKMNGMWYVRIFRMYAENGGYDSYRCQYVGRWESVKKSKTAMRILQFMKENDLNPVRNEPDFSYLGIRTQKFGMWNGECVVETIIDIMCKAGTVFLALVGVFATGTFIWGCLSGMKIALQKIKERLEV